MNKRTYFYFRNSVSIFLIMFSICAAMSLCLFFSAKKYPEPVIENYRIPYMKNAAMDLIKDSNLIENECTWEFGNLNFELFKFRLYMVWGVDGFLIVTNNPDKVEKIRFFGNFVYFL